jgi:hypothetical protein
MKRNLKMPFFYFRLSSGNGAKIARKATIELFKKFTSNKNVTVWVNRKEGKKNLKMIKRLIN